MLKNKKLSLLIILSVAFVSASAVSHALVIWLKIETATGKAWNVRSGASARMAFVAGSSLAGDGIAWDEVSQELNVNLLGWGVAGSSPWEWESFQSRAVDVQTSFIVVSAYDLNERFLCDFHAEVVSPAMTMAHLRQCGADWASAKRVLSQYPLNAVRILFPTAGRSQGVMTGVREKLLEILGRSGGADSDRGPTLDLGKAGSVSDVKSENILAWSPARMLRRLALLRNACAGRHDFDGPKMAAFIRMLQHSQKQGRTVVVVLPVSASYAREFLGESVRSRFDQALANAQQIVPEVQWLRLDQVPELNSDDKFWDLVHMNRQGKQIATKTLLEQFH